MSRHCMLLRQILTPFSSELVSNSSCSVEPIAHWDSPYYPVLSCLCLSWMTSIFGGLEWVSHIVKMQYSRNHTFHAMAAIGLHLDNLLSEGFSHFRMARHLAKSVKTGNLGFQLNRVCQIIKEISTRCQINTNFNFEIFLKTCVFTPVRITYNRTKQ